MKNTVSQELASIDDDHGKVGIIRTFKEKIKSLRNNG